MELVFLSDVLAVLLALFLAGLLDCMTLQALSDCWLNICQVHQIMSNADWMCICLLTFEKVVCGFHTHAVWMAQVMLSIV